MRGFNEIEEKILDTALKLVANKGSFNITVRELSREANVNIGAINYYFGTKDKMTELLKEFYIENTLDAYKDIFNEDLSNREKIRGFSDSVIVYCLKYPGTLNILKEAYEFRNEDRGFKKIVDTTNNLNSQLELILRDIYKDLDDKEYEFRKNVFISSIVYPPLNMDVFRLNKNLMEDEGKRRDYIDYTLNLLGI